MKYVVAVLALLASSALAQEQTSLRDLQFLTGSWEAASGPPGVSGATSFRSDLQGKVIVRTNRAEYPASPGRPASTHDDLMIVYIEGAPPLRAIYFDNEGHVIQYSVAVQRPGAVAFTSEPTAGQPRYRLSYVSAPGDRLSGEFASASPEKPAEFTPMFKWELKRQSRQEPTKTPEKGPKGPKNAA